MAKVSKVWKGNADLEPLLVPIADLMLDPANVRKHGDRNRETIKASLMRYGQQKPCVVDKQGIVRAGNGTMAEARELGWTHLAVTRSDLTTTDLVGYAVADNRTSDLSTFDDAALADTLKALEADGFDLDAAGFNSAELDELIGKLEASNGVVVDDPQGEWEGMPEFEHEDLTSQFRAIVHFADESDMRAFEKLVGQSIPTNTKSIWYPKAERQVVKGTGYVSDES